MYTRKYLTIDFYYVKSRIYGQPEQKQKKGTKK